MRKSPGAMVVLLAAFGPFGCARDRAEELVIASGWPASDRAALEAGFQRWLAASPEVARRTPTLLRIRWILLAPGDEPARAARRLAPVDLLLGGPASSYRRLDRDGRLAPVEGEGKPAWRVARQTVIGLAMNPRATRGTARPTPDQGVPAPGRGSSPKSLLFDDPRADPVSLAWAKGRLGAEGWAEGYARLVRGAGHSRRIGRRPGAALAAVERGEAALAPALVPSGADRRAPFFFLTDVQADAPVWVEGVAILRGGRHQQSAQRFLRFLAETGQAKPPPEGPEAPEADDLLADLLGATLVDAQDELWGASEALAASRDPDRAERWMTEPPPWPPASVAKLLNRGDDTGLVETLAAEIAPEADVRAWLLRSWLRPARPIDGAFLVELATANNGRVARAPHVRAWLRAEWTAWARQRYRRVARLTSQG